jgi:hypothetical protein
MWTAHLEVWLGRDRIMVLCRETGASVSRESPRPFSSQHRLIADQDQAFDLLKDAIREVDRRPWFKRLFGRVSVNLEDGLNSPADRDDARKLLTDLGATIDRIG